MNEIETSYVQNALDAGHDRQRISDDLGVDIADVDSVASEMVDARNFDLGGLIRSDFARPVPGLPEYVATRGGQIISMKYGKVRVLSQNLTKQYWCVKADGHRRYVHQLIAITFIGPRPAGTETCHNDGNTRNNRPGNLRYDTHKANMQDAVVHGRHFRGGPHRAASKLTNEQVVEIKIALAVGWRSQRQIAFDYGVDPANISAIAIGKTWRHVQVPPRSVVPDPELERWLDALPGNQLPDHLLHLA